MKRPFFVAFCLIHGLSLASPPMPPEPEDPLARVLRLLGGPLISTVSALPLHLPRAQPELMPEHLVDDFARRLQLKRTRDERDAEIFDDLEPIIHLDEEEPVRARRFLPLPTVPVDEATIQELAQVNAELVPAETLIQVQARTSLLGHLPADFRYVIMPMLTMRDALACRQLNRAHRAWVEPFVHGRVYKQIHHVPGFVSLLANPTSPVLCLVGRIAIDLLSSSQVPAFMNFLLQNPHLQRNLHSLRWDSECYFDSIDEEDMQILSEGLRALRIRNLELGLESDDALGPLLQDYEVLGRLRLLHLMGPFTDAGVRHLVAVAPHLTRLRTLGIREAQISEPVKRELRQALPRCDIEFDDEESDDEESST